MFRIDAGAQEVGVRFGVKTTRIDHVDTPEELRRRTRGGAVYGSRYDYQPTDVLRLFLYHDTRKVASWQDTARIPIESRLVAVLDHIEQSTRTVVAHREAARRRWEEEQRRLEEEQRQQKRAAHYDTWVGALLTLQRRSREHAELVAIVGQLREHLDRVNDERVCEDLAAFVTWAQSYLEACNPFTSLNLPAGEPPEMTYGEWERWKTYLDDQKRRGTFSWHLR